MTYHRTTIKVDLEYLPLGKDSAPVFLQPVLKFIEENVTQIGLFRTNGSRLAALKINEAVSQHVPYIPEDCTVYDVCSFLKMWLLELPVPLIPPSVIATHYGPDICTSTVDILSHVTYTSRLCLARLFSMMQLILRHSEQNQMNFQNLSTCFVYALMQKFKNVPINFQFQVFFYHACTLLNEEGTDFNLRRKNNPIKVAPRRRNSRHDIKPQQRRNIGYIRKSEIFSQIPQEVWASEN